MNKPAVKTTTDIATLLHRKGLETNKWNQIPIRFGLRDLFRIYVKEPMKGNISIELAAIVGLYEQAHERTLCSYSDLTADEKRTFYAALERWKYAQVDDDAEQYIYRVKNHGNKPFEDTHMRNVFSDRLNENDYKYWPNL